MQTIDPNQVPKRRLYTGAFMPAIGLGTFGSDHYTAEQIANAVEQAIYGGYRLIDCAAVYQNEAQIGKALHRVFQSDKVKREELFLVSKVWNDSHRAVEVSCRKSLSDLGVDYLDLYLIHWPFPNYHAPGCDGDSRNPDSKPFSVEEFVDTWRQCEALVEAGLVKHIGMSNMTVKKLEQVLPHCNIRPAALEMELHPSFQQPKLFSYACQHGLMPIGYSPIGSPVRPERDRTPGDLVDIELPAVVAAAKAHGVHPAIICLKWAAQRGQIPIPFSVKPEQFLGNLASVTKDPLTEEEMKAIEASDGNCRLIKGQVFLWEGAQDWRAIWED